MKTLDEFPRFRWIPAVEVKIDPAVLAACGGSTFLAGILTRRGFTDPAQICGFLNPDAYEPSLPGELPGMADAVARLLHAVEHSERVLVWGDFDVDGQTSTTILVTAFQTVGLDVAYHIPLRESEGHGIHIPTLEQLLEGINLVVTCDTGISANAAVDYIRSRGADVIITDHHELPKILPAGTIAMVNPHFLPEDHPLATLPGCGVAYKLAQALFAAAQLRRDDSDLLDLTALGLVADVAELRGDARYLLQRGLKVLQSNRRLGLAKLYELIELNPQVINEADISFQLAPRLNAVGRLADANTSVDLFTTQDQARAAFLAQDMEGLNAQRKLLTSQVLQAALQQIEQNPAWLNDPVLVLIHPDWVGGVLGIVASHLVNRFNRPVILLRVNSGGVAAGSARSIPGVNITRAIQTHAGILLSSGGHPMAAGLSLPAELVPEFRQMLAHTIRAMVTEATLEEAVLEIDGSLSVAMAADFALHPDNEIAALDQLAPFGQGNPAPVFVMERVCVQDSLLIGKTREHWLLNVADAVGAQAKVFWWQAADQSPPEGWFDLAVTARITDWRGEKQLQLEWMDALPLPDTVQAELPVINIQYLDYRQEHDPFTILEGLQASRNMQVWSEGVSRDQSQGDPRMELTPADDLVIWTAPPGGAEIQEVIDRVKPRRVFLFCVDPGLDSARPFTQRLFALLRGKTFCQSQPVSLEKLAAATAQKSETVVVGLKYLEAAGFLCIEKLAEGSLTYSVAEKPTATLRVREFEQMLVRMLKETAAFRDDLAHASLDRWKADYPLK